MSAGSKTGAFYKRDRSWHPPPFTPSYRTSVLRSPRKALVSLDNTVSEISGPVFPESMLGPLDDDLILNFAQPGESAIGPRIIVYGRVMDQDGRGIPNTLAEVWQANAGGRYRHRNDGYLAPLDPNFGGCGRMVTGEDGSYRFRTILPGPYPWPNGPNDWRPSHIHFSILGTGFAQRLITQMYFEGDPLIGKCPIVNTTLDMENTIPMDALAYRFDIVLRGRRQTLFENRRDGL